MGNSADPDQIWVCAVCACPNTWGHCGAGVFNGYNIDMGGVANSADPDLVWVCTV